MSGCRFSLALLAALLASPAAWAQTRVTAQAELTTDYRMRGLSWSDGKSAAQAGITLDLPSGFNVGGWATTTRGSYRHGGADLGFDLIGGYRTTGGPVRFDAAVIGRLFAGAAGKRDYVELYGGAGTTLGPANLQFGASYAPDQRAIGGDNLYLQADARVAMIGTPFTLTGHVGRSSGESDHWARSARLRPSGNYIDWSAAVDYVIGPVSVGLVYSDTDINRPPAFSRSPEFKHSGATLLARARLIL